MMKKALLTGASGFIGRHAIESLLGRGFEVHALSSRSLGLDAPGVCWHRADLLDLNQIAPLMAKIHPTHLLHFAWVTSPGNYFTSLDNLRWVQASIELMREFVEQGGERIVMAGSCAEYDWNQGICSERQTPLAPAQLYGACKQALQGILQRYAERVGVNAAWGRIFYLFGPHEQRGRLIPSIIRSLRNDKPIQCMDEEGVRDYSYVQDIADGFVAILESKVSGPINIASGIGIKIKDLIHKIAQRMNKEDRYRIEPLPGLGARTKRVIADVKRLREEIGWLPQYGLEGGLDRTVFWWMRTLIERTNEPRLQMPAL